MSDNAFMCSVELKKISFDTRDEAEKYVRAMLDMCFSKQDESVELLDYISTPGFPDGFEIIETVPDYIFNHYKEIVSEKLALKFDVPSQM